MPGTLMLEELHSGEFADAVFNNMVDALVISDHRGRIVLFNPGAERMFGYASDEVLGENVSLLMPAGEAHRHDAYINSYQRTGEAKIIGIGRQEIARRKDGEFFPIDLAISELRLHGELHYLGIIRDITRRVEAERQQQEQARELQAIVDQMVDGIITIDHRGLMTSANPAAQRIFGYTEAELLGNNVKMLMPSPYREAHDGYLRNYQKTGDARIIGIGREVEGQRANGEVFPMDLAVAEVRRGGQTSYVGTVRDVTERKRAEEEINNLAFYDPLTALPNRRLLRDRLHQAIVSCERTRRHIAVLFIDLDNFKTLNDTAGHEMGDRLLQQVARRLRKNVRTGDTVARLGGDEFVVVLEGLATDAEHAAAEAETVAEKLQASLVQPFRIQGLEHRSSPSIGVTLCLDDDMTPSDLLKQADMAMYEAKAAGRNAVRFFDPDMQHTVNTRATLETDLARALEQQQFHLYLQPKFDDARQMLGAEALIRWQHPQRGLLSPADFIPIAEESGLIIRIGRWVMSEACDILAGWGQDPERADWTLSVNVSPKQFQTPDFVSWVENAVYSRGVNPQKLYLEMTESVMAEELAVVVEKMGRLQRQGIRFSLDDFGTGYSSLSYLKYLPLQELKIDRSFVQDVVWDPQDQGIADMIVSLARAMHLDVVAEGVETEAQLEYLVSLGCRRFQGFLLGRPVPVGAFG